MDDLQIDNANNQPEDNPATEPIAAEEATDQAGRQAQGGAPTEKDLFKGTDPNKLPPEIRGHYDSMLKDYRDKTAKLSETIKSEVSKAVSQYRQKADEYDTITSQDEFVSKWNEYVNSLNTAREDKDPKLAAFEDRIREMERKEELREMEKLTDAFASAVDDKGQKVNGNFDRLNDIVIGKSGENDYSLLRACIELSGEKTPERKLSKGYQMANRIFTDIFELGRKAGIGRIQEKVMNGTQPPSNADGIDVSFTEKRPRSAREAMAMARRGQVVSRD